MIAVRLLTPEEIAERLTSCCCNKDSYENAHCSLWFTAWNHYFTVPKVGPDGLCAEYVLERIIEQEVEGTRPQHH